MIKTIAWMLVAVWIFQIFVLAAGWMMHKRSGA